MQFSDRIGKTTPPTSLVREELTTDLLNSLWNVCSLIINSNHNNYPRETHLCSPRTYLMRRLWMNFFKWTIETIPMHNEQILKDSAVGIVRDWFLNKSAWYQKYNFIEFLATQEGENSYETFNQVLKREFCAYRFINAILIEMTSENEIAEINEALNSSNKFEPIKIHLSRALALMSNKENPDFRNSIKESISAVESLCYIILGTNDTLGKALAKIEKKHQVPATLKSAFSALYGYTSEEGGIRHGLLSTDIKVELEEARFMLIACSAFTNYLKAKM